MSMAALHTMLRSGGPAMPHGEESARRVSSSRSYIDKTQRNPMCTQPLAPSVV